VGPGLDEYFLFFVFYKTFSPQAVGCRFRIALVFFVFSSFLGVIKSKLKSRELDKFLSIMHKHGMYVN
jgi:hypothetical protein